MEKLFFKLVTILMMAFSSFPAFSQWTDANFGLYGGNVYSITVSVNHIYAGAFGYGVYRSSDNSVNWIQKSTGLPNGSVQTVCTFDSTIFAAFNQGGIFASPDQGETWFNMSNGIKDDIHKIYCDGKYLYALTDSSGVYCSSDRGNKWSLFNSGLTDLHIRSISGSNDSIFIGTSSGVFMNLNHGFWIKRNNGLPSSNIHAICKADKHLFACSNNNGVFYSSNNGGNWSLKNNGLKDLYFHSIVSFGKLIILGTTYNGIFISNDNGSTWIQKNNGLTNYEINCITIKSDTVLIGTFGSGVYFSTDSCNTWVQKNQGLKALEVDALSSDGKNLFAGTAQSGLFLSTDVGTSWVSKYNRNSDLLHIRTLANTGQTVYAGCYMNGIYKTSDCGTMWKDCNQGLSNKDIYIIGKNNSDLYAGTHGGGIFFSSDSGKSWSNRNKGLNNLNVQAFAFDSNKVYAGTHGGGVNLSTDKGMNWSAKNSGLGNLDIQTLAMKDKSIIAGTLFGTAPGIYSSTDFGISWNQRNAGLSNTGIFKIVVSGNDIIAGTLGGGIFVSSDDAKSWIAKNSGLTDLKILSITTIGDMVFVSTGDGVYKAKIPDLVNSSATIKLIKPNGGERFKVGTNENFTWDYTGALDFVSIDYSTDNGQTWKNIVQKLDASINSYIWNVEKPTSTQCLVRVYKFDNPSIADTSDKVFTIYQDSVPKGRKEIVNVCYSDGSEIKTSFKTDINKIYRIRIIGVFSPWMRSDNCGESSIGCGIDAAYIYNIPSTQKSNWSLLEPFWTGYTDSLKYGNRKVGFRLNDAPISVYNFTKTHDYYIDKQGTGDFFKFKIIDSLWNSNKFVANYDPSATGGCLAVSIEEIRDTSVGFCEPIQCLCDSNGKLIGIRLKLGLFERDTSKLNGFRNLLKKLGHDQIAIMINGKFVCIDSMLCSSDSIINIDRVGFGIGIILDISGSMAGQISNTDRTIRLDALKKYITKFLDNLNQKDSCFLTSFDDQIYHLQDWTKDKNLLKSEVNGLSIGGGTAIWDAVNDGINKLSSTVPPKAIIVLSDGADNASNITFINLLQKVNGLTNLPIYFIGLGFSNSIVDSIGRVNMQKLANNSKGKFFSVNDTIAMANAFNTIAESINEDLCCEIKFTFAGTNTKIDSAGKVRLIFTPSDTVMFSSELAYNCTDCIVDSKVIKGIDKDSSTKKIPNSGIGLSIINKLALLTYSITEYGEVTIEISDLLGNIINVEHKGNQAAGTYEYIFDSNQVTSGVYIACVKWNDKFVSRKIIVYH
ncbi:MAG: VWA domain-containing protein [Candidatus Kapabacteria bacterium]|nr:VWA domain-containing protein [Candidatus Kapabacteria bacterium]